MAELPTAGQIVRVTTLRLGGGKPMHSPFIVAEPDPAKAEALVLQVMTPDEKAKAICPLGAEVIKAFGLKPGEFTHWRWWWK
jgi:hypothetical protein